MSHRATTIAFITACAAMAWAGAAYSQTAGEVPSHSAAAAGASAAASRAWEENGMQVIELAPARRSAVYATRGADGRIDITHGPASEAKTHND